MVKSFFYSLWRCHQTLSWSDALSALCGSASLFLLYTVFPQVFPGPLLIRSIQSVPAVWWQSRSVGVTTQGKGSVPLHQPPLAAR